MAGARKGHTVVAHLAVFGASILLPVLALFAIVLWQGFSAERTRIEDEARDGARNTAIAIDQRIGTLTSMLQALATSPALDRGDLRTFHQQMIALARSQDLALSLRDLNSRPILNSGVPFGELPPPGAEIEHDRLAIAGESPAVSRFFVGSISRTPRFGVVVPVFHDGVIVYLLGTASSPDHLAILAREQISNPDFRVRVIDQQNSLLAAIPDRPDGLGKPVGRAPVDEPSWRETADDGKEILWTPWYMEKAPWRVEVGVPVAALYSPLWGRLIGLMLAAGALVGIAATATVLFGRRIGVAVETIAAAAAALGHGADVRVRRSSIHELDVVGRVLEEAARERDRRESELIASEMRLADAAEALARLNADLERQVRERTEETRAALQQLFEAQKMESIGQLTGGVAHDFNNLLMAILSSLRPLRRFLPEDPKPRRLVDGAVEAAERGAALTQRLLAFARRQELSPTNVDVVALMRGMESLFQASIGASTHLTVDISPETPQALVDRNQLELALLNLVVNARDAMPGGGSITVKAEPFTAASAMVKDLGPGDYVRVAVTDTGVGMDEVTAARAIEPFYTTKGPGKGTGLGLSMVHGLAAQSGGAMRIVSAPGRGTTVELYLKPASEAADARQDSQPAAVGRPRPFTVMVVDDDALVLSGTVDMLEDSGQVAIACASPSEALDYFRAGRRCDVVVTDFAMPAMDGAELARLVRAQWGVPVILVSGYAELPEKDDLPRLHKPYTIEDLLAAIGRVAAPRPGADGAVA
ncbi:MAG: ATP-binding protein [Gemmatimonas sp.]